jgi:hypothetical protein
VICHTQFYFVRDAYRIFQLFSSSDPCFTNGVFLREERLCVRSWGERELGYNWNAGTLCWRSIGEDRPRQTETAIGDPCWGPSQFRSDTARPRVPRRPTFTHGCHRRLLSERRSQAMLTPTVVCSRKRSDDNQRVNRGDDSPSCLVTSAHTDSTETPGSCTTPAIGAISIRERRPHSAP